MAAISSALLAVLKSGDEVIATRQTVWRLVPLFRDTLRGWGFARTSWSGSRGCGCAGERENSRALCGVAHESDTPLVDLKKAVALARKHKWFP